MQWPAPKNVHETYIFLELCGYYRRYVRDFAAHASPLHELTRNDVAFIWDERRQSAFNFLKQALISAPILAMSQDKGTFVLDVDASDFAIGAVLQQEQEGILRVIGYASRTFNVREKKYCITRKKLAVMDFGLNQYRLYIGRHFVVRSDHAALIYLQSAKELIGQQAQGLDFMEEFNFDLQHRASMAHGNANALSRKVHQASVEQCIQCRQRGFTSQGETMDTCQASCDQLIRVQ